MTRHTAEVSGRGVTFVVVGVIGGPFFALAGAQVGAGAGSSGSDDWGGALTGAGIGLLVGGLGGLAFTLAGFSSLIRQIRRAPADDRSPSEAWSLLWATTVTFAAAALVLILVTDWPALLVVWGTVHVYLVPLALLLRRRWLQRWHLLPRARLETFSSHPQPRV